MRVLTSALAVLACAAIAAAVPQNPVQKDDIGMPKGARFGSSNPAPPGIFVSGRSDDCSMPTGIVGQGAFAFDTSTATVTDPPITGCGSSGNDKSIWYRWTADDNGEATITTCDPASNFDTLLVLYSDPGVGNCPLSSHQIGCNDDMGSAACPGAGLLSRIIHPVTSGTDYLIRVRGFSASSGQGILHISIDPPIPPPANDDCSNPDVIAGQGIFGPYDNSLATTGTEGQNESNCLEFGFTAIAKDVWFEWTADVTGTATVSTCNTTTVDTKIAAYPGSGCPADGTSLACNDDAPGCGLRSEISFPVVAGGVYTIQAGSYPGGSVPGGVSSLEISIVPDPTPIVAFCFGDGSGAPCPCPAFPGGPGEGCQNATGSGSALSWTGSESVSANDLVLIANNLPGGSNTFGVFFQGTVLENGGLGTPFGDGLLCANTSIVRLELAPNVGGTATSTTSISGSGGMSPGLTAYYQFWYRAVAGPCGFGFNTSSAVEVNWDI